MRHDWPCATTGRAPRLAVRQAIRQAESSFSGPWRWFTGRVYARSWHGP
ncbi:hypothetical protein GGP47_000647 [Salinibacter ruber]|nr:hypothetical protein [Salinibacter ruber]